MAVQCEQNIKDCLQLSSILRAFSASISEEQAWAVCFQTAKCMMSEWTYNSTLCYRMTDTSHVFINKDGSVHKSSLRLPVIGGIRRELAASEYMLVSHLGLIIFHALDYGLSKDEERKLSSSLEVLIERMTCTAGESEKGEFSSDDEDSIALTADEGIEQDSGEDDNMSIGTENDKSGLTLVKVMEMCANHLSCPVQADTHYKAVCRALVTEVLELSMFLENISSGTGRAQMSYNEDEDWTLAKLGIQDWAKLWMQVIQQLRQGVKLKKIESAHLIHPIEFALTPYEMLLDDIRSRRYKLREVMVNGDIPPRVKKDAHDLILDFIRSRPPLVPVSKRKIPPTPVQLNLYEKLMISIRQPHKLKPTAHNGNVETSRTKLQDSDVTPRPHRRLIKANLSLRLSSSFGDDDVDDIPQTPPNQTNSVPLRTGKASIVRSSSHTGASTSESDRRNSITVCESLPKHSTTSLDRNVRADYWKCSQWQSLECLSLTLEEVVHIRSVLTKADLETLIIDPVLYEDVLKGKVCFTCKYTRFAFFGPWATKCKMCERSVCDKCCTKMRIPTEHFARIPVYMLTPSPSPPPEEESSQSLWKFSDVFSFNSNSPTEEPSKPKESKLNMLRHSESLQAITKNGGVINSKPKKAALVRAKTIQNSSEKSNSHEKVKGPLMSVCCDCKVMVCNIISASAKKVPDTKKNNMAGPRKKSNNPVLMSPLEETPLPSPDEGFNSLQNHVN